MKLASAVVAASAFFMSDSLGPDFPQPARVDMATMAIDAAMDDLIFFMRFLLVCLSFRASAHRPDASHADALKFRASLACGGLLHHRHNSIYQTLGAYNIALAFRF